MSTRRVVRRWKGGEVITAVRLNQGVDAVNAALGGARPPRSLGSSDAGAQVTEDDSDELEAATVWRWVSSRTRTVRIEDADDSATYVDVEITSAIRFRKPDGELIELQVEDPNSG